MRNVMAAMLALALCGCGMATLSAGGSRVRMVTEQPAPECKVLGAVNGRARGGSFSGGAKMREAALNDARNKAAERGATHIQPGEAALNKNTSSNTTTAADGTEDTTYTTTKTVSINAVLYKCPATIAPAPPAPAPTAPAAAVVPAGQPASTN